MGYEEVAREARAILASGAYDAALRAEALMRSYAEGAESRREQWQALLFAAECLVKAGHSVTAMERFASLEAFPLTTADRITLYEVWGAMVYHSGRTEVAVYVRKRLQTALIENADTSIPTLSFAYSALAKLYVMDGDLEQAERWEGTAVELALAAEHGRAEAYSTLSIIREQRCDFIRALEAIETAMQYMTARHCIMEAQADCARLQLALGDTKTASHHMRAAVDFPDFRDRSVLAHVLNAITEFIGKDPDTARMMTQRLAVYLEEPPSKGVAT